MAKDDKAALKAAKKQERAAKRQQRKQTWSQMWQAFNMQRKQDKALIHESIGEVVLDNTGTYAPGDTVVMIPNLPCESHEVIAEVSRGLGEAMVGINVDDLPVDHRLAERGW